MSERTPVLKVDDEHRIVSGEVYAPDLPDTDGEFMVAAEIEKMAHRFMAKLSQKNVDRMHDRQKTDSCIVESFIARAGDPTYIAGAWVVAVKIEDDQLWADVKAGKFNGFSFDGLVKTRTVEVEMEYPESVEGWTHKREDHEHRFFVRFADDGTYLGGRTDEVDGHFHIIKRSTVTSEAAGHNHRFSYMEALVGEQGQSQKV